MPGGHPFGYKMSEETKKKISLARTGKKHTKESKEKMRIARSGPGSSFWKGGLVSLNISIRASFLYRQWRSDVYTRDDFTCQKCYKRGGKLEAHHIKSLSKIINDNNIKTMDDAVMCEELWNINNGQTMCEECHKKTDNYGRQKINNQKLYEKDTNK